MPVLTSGAPHAAPADHLGPHPSPGLINGGMGCYQQESPGSGTPPPIRRGSSAGTIAFMGTYVWKLKTESYYIRMLPRRRFLPSSLALAAFESVPAKLLRAAAPVFKALPAWKPGILEIHQIATNRGNSTLLILPDGPTMMVDAGAIYGTTPYLSDPVPSGQYRPGEWIGRYAKRRFVPNGITTIDTFLLTHLHGDHVGYLPPDGPLSSDGTYRLTGVSDVAAIVPIQRFVDRAWPDYTYPVPADSDFQKNYRAFLQAQIKTGKKVERFRPGSKDQFALQHKSAE